jgi:hypothetical protein
MTALRDEYQREAAYAMEMADRAPSEDLRAHWLRLARKWLDMLPQRERPSKQAFDPRDLTSRQDGSKASN